MRPRNVTGRRGVREPGPQVITFGVEKLVLPQAKQSEPQAGRTIAANSKFPVYTKQSNWPYLPRDATANERCQRNIGLPPAVSVDENRVGDQVIPNRGRPPGVTPRRSGHRQPVSAQRSLASSRSRDTWRRVRYFIGQKAGLASAAEELSALPGAWRRGFQRSIAAAGALCQPAASAGRISHSRMDALAGTSAVRHWRIWMKRNPLQPSDNPFGTRLSPMSSVRSGVFL
jgi:hypothetical protein